MIVWCWCVLTRFFVLVVLGWKEAGLLYFVEKMVQFEKEQVQEDGESLNGEWRLFEDECLVEWKTEYELKSATKRGRKRSAPMLSEEARSYLVPGKFRAAMGLTAAV